MGSILTNWSIYGSLACYLAAVLLLLGSTPSSLLRVLWTVGALLLLLHAGFAFHFYHGWSHASAVEDTAAQTEAILGWPFGQGICFSYLLVVMWLFDAGRLWIPRPSQANPQRAVLFYSFFILFNGTVVFEHGLVRWAGVAGTVLIAVLIYRRWRLLPEATRP